MSDNESSCDKCLLKVIDIEVLIREVEKRPSLYDKQMKEYNDRDLKEKLWNEVCVRVVPNWRDLAAKDKNANRTEVQKKWKNLKDCFLKELVAQRKASEKGVRKYRRKYIHFDELSFLLPYVKGREGSRSARRREKDVKQESSEGASSHHDYCTNNSSSLETETPVLPGKKRKRGNVTAREAPVLNVLKAEQRDTAEEDKNFALMLVPMLGKLNEEQKHYARVEILNVMRNARYFNPEQQPAYSVSSDGHQLPVSQDYYPLGQTDNHSLNAGSHQRFYSEDVLVSVVSPSSVSGSDYE